MTLPDVMGSGGGFLDFDTNHAADILLLSGGVFGSGDAAVARQSPRLYLNNLDGTFADATEAVGLNKIQLHGMGFAAADYDHDSDIDLFLTGVGRSVLLLNEGGLLVDGTATHLTYEEAGAAGGAADWSMGAVWLDFDLDHKLDLFVCNYAAWAKDGAPGPAARDAELYKGQTCRLFQNVGEGRLVEVTRSAGLLNPRGRSASVVVEDLDRDFRPDLIVTNESGPDFVYQRGGAGRYDEIGEKIRFGVGGAGRLSRGIDTCDGVNDGAVWVAVGSRSGRMALLTRASAAAGFMDGTAAAGLADEQRATSGVVMADVDLDGFADLLVARDAPGDTDGPALRFFRNDGTGGFSDLSGEAGADLARPGAGRGLATADIDNDGDLDILLTINGGRPRLLRNDLSATTNVVRVRLRGAWQDYEGIGCLVRCRVASGESYTRLIRTGGSYLSQSELVATFVIGTAPGGAIDVRWPNGFYQTVGVLGGGATYVVGEGRGGVIDTMPFRR